MADIYVTNRLTDITLSGGDTTVIFDRSYQRFALKSDDALSLKDAENEYKTSDGDGLAKMKAGFSTNKIIISGSGSGRLWAGMSFDDCPFVESGKGGGVSFLGTTTTALSEGSTANPIVIDGQNVTAKGGDIAIYNGREFMFNGTTWSEFGDMSGLGDLAYKDDATTSYKPAGTISAQTFTGTAATISVSGTPTGDVDITPTSDNVKTVNSVGTLPSVTYVAADEELIFDAGSLPTTFDKSVVTGVSATFSGDALTSTGNYTPAGEVSQSTFDGTTVTLTVS